MNANDLARERRHTGAVDLLLTGERTSYLSGDELVREIRGTKFVKANCFVQPNPDGEFRIEPCELKKDAIEIAMVRGLVYSRFSGTGVAPGGFSALRAEKYYACLDFVEGPELEEGRWLVRYVDAKGTVLGHSLEVQVKRVLDFHVDAEDMKKHHFPSILTHGFGHEGVAARLGLGNRGGFGLGTDDWVMTCVNWKPIGSNADGSVMCAADCICSGRPQAILG